MLIAGERRKYSAIAAGLATIPVYVRNDLSPVHQVAGMLVENIGRDDLTPVEEAVAIQQLAGFDGVTQKDITAMTGIKAGKVRQALIVARSEVATEVAGRYDLTLDQAAVVAEFGDDPEAVKLLTAAAVKQPEQWPHVVSRLRHGCDHLNRPHRDHLIWPHLARSEVGVHRSFDGGLEPGTHANEVEGGTVRGDPQGQRRSGQPVHP